ncbi:MAG: PLDc N-terminal domain-containing protein [Pseudomonadota bacterium]
MNVLITLLFLFLVGCGLVALIPILTFGLGVLAVLACVFLWLLPILIIANSDKTSGGEKAAWILAIIFLSWFAWIFYFLLAPIKPRRSYYDRRYDY